MANTIALNAVFEVEPLPHIQRLPDRRWERISFRIPSTLTPDPCVVTADSGHSLISSGSSLSWVFVLVLGIPADGVEGMARHGTWDDFPRFRSQGGTHCLCQRTHHPAASATHRYAAAGSRPCARRRAFTRSRTRRTCQPNGPHLGRALPHLECSVSWGSSAVGATVMGGD